MPLIFVWGLEGFAVGMLAATVPLVAVRLLYLSRLFELGPILRNVARGFVPGVVAVVAALLVRVAWGVGERTEAQAVAELAAFGITAIAITVLLERGLLNEFRGYLRRPSTRVEQVV